MGHFYLYVSWDVFVDGICLGKLGDKTRIAMVLELDPTLQAFSRK